MPQKSSTISPADAVAAVWALKPPSATLAGSGPKTLERLAKIKGAQLTLVLALMMSSWRSMSVATSLFVFASTVELEDECPGSHGNGLPVLLNHSKTSALVELPELPDAFFSDKD